jgi:dihydrofolate reductase
MFSRLCTSLDGIVATEEGWPVQLSYSDWDAGQLGFYELQSRCDAVLMGRTTFEPALSAPHWPWGELKVYVLGSHRPEGTPEQVIVDSDPLRLLKQLRQASQGGDVHLVGGPRTIETFRRLDALDEFRLLVLPMIAGTGRRITPDLDQSAKLIFLEAKSWSTGAVELVYGTRPE